MDSRCDTHDAKIASSSECPECGDKGKKVEQITLQHLLTDDNIPFIGDIQYYFCESLLCSVVYFSNYACQRFHKSDLKIRVGAKETEDPIVVCYCFGFTKKMILDEICFSEKRTIPSWIREQATAGNCECLIKNPKGGCCLGDVGRIGTETIYRRKAIENEGHLLAVIEDN